MGLLAIGCTDEEPPSPDPLPTSAQATPSSEWIVPTSNYQPGEPGIQVGIAGELIADSDGCLLLFDPVKAQDLYVLWPEGFSAGSHGRDQFVLVDELGSVVAGKGDSVISGGIYGPVDDFEVRSGEECLTEATEVAQVQSVVVRGD